MKAHRSIFTLALIASIAALAGCDNAPNEDIPSAVNNSAPAAATPAPDAAPAPEAAPEAAPAPEEAAPAPEAAAAPEAAPMAAAGPATYTITPNDTDTIGFTGYKITGKKQGSWVEYNGTVELTDGTIESAKITIAFTMESMVTSAKLLTETLHTESWFNVAAFPEATFTSTSVVKEGDHYNVSGDLVIRGVSKNITFPATISVEGDTLKTESEFKLLRSDWGMTDTGLADDLIKDDVVITFDITAKKA